MLIDIFALLILVNIFIGLFLFIFGNSLRVARINNRKAILENYDTIVSEYEPPLNLRPAEIAYLYDQFVSGDEFLATALDIEQRGYVKLQNTENGVIGIQTNKKPDDLQNFEMSVYATIVNEPFKLHNNSVVSDSNFEKLKHELHDALIAKGLISENYSYFTSTNITKVSLIMFLITWVAIMVSGGQLGQINSFEELNSFTQALAFTLIGGAFAFISLVILHYGMTYYVYENSLAEINNNLEDLWPKLEGFKLYIEKAEQDEISYANQTELEVTKNKLLPYAIAYNLDVSLEDRFNNI